MGSSRLVIFSIFFFKIAFSFPSISNFSVYYGKNELEKLKNFDIVILQSSNYSMKEIIYLKKNSTKTLAYLSLGEIKHLIKRTGKKPAGYFSFYIDKNNDGKPDINKYWNSYYVNPGDKNWKKYIEKEIINIKNKGFDGIFLDTIDTVDLYPEFKNGMVSLIEFIREKNPEFMIVANRGFSIFEDIFRYIDGILFECLSTHYDFSRKKYEKWEGSDNIWVENKAMQIREIIHKNNRNSFLLLALDYCRENDNSLIEYAERKAKKFGFLIYISEQ